MGTRISIVIADSPVEVEVNGVPFTGPPDPLPLRNLVVDPAPGVTQTLPDPLQPSPELGTLSNEPTSSPATLSDGSMGSVSTLGEGSISSGAQPTASVPEERPDNTGPPLSGLSSEQVAALAPSPEAVTLQATEDAEIAANPVVEVEPNTDNL